MQPARHSARSRRRGILVAGVLGLALLVAAASVVVWAYTAKPGDPGQYADELDTLTRAASGAPAGAKDEWVDFVLTVGAVHAFQDSYFSDHPRPDDWPPAVGWPTDVSELNAEGPVNPAVAAYFNGFLDAFGASDLPARIDRLAAIRLAPRPAPQGRTMDWPLPELGPTRFLARLNAARMRRASLAGDFDELVRAHEANLAVANVLSRQVTLIDYLFASAITILSNQHLRYALTDHALDAATLERLVAVHDRHPLGDVTTAFRGERFFALDTVNWTHTDDGSGGGTLLPAVLATLEPPMRTPITANPLDPAVLFAPTHPIRNVLGLAFAGKRETVARIDGLFNLYANDPARPGIAPTLPTLDAELDRLGGRFPILAVLFPALSKVQSTVRLTTHHVNATRLLLAIELHRARRGTPPDTLAALVPGELPAIPPDPFSPDGFRYLRVDPAVDPHGRAYLLYTVGLDGKDNGGVQDPKNPMAAMLPGPKSEGLDTVVNPPRPTSSTAP